MKRKIIQKNKQKYTERTKNRLYYMITLGDDLQLFKNGHKYIRTEMVENAYRRNDFSKMVNVPITYTSKVKRSRIKNRHMGSRVFRDIQYFNEKYNLQKELTDIPVKSYRD